MRMSFRVIMICIVLLAACACSESKDNQSVYEQHPNEYKTGNDLPNQKNIPGWFGSRPYLLNTSLWRQDIDMSVKPPFRELGCIGVGNGKVFGILGNQYPLSSWHNLGGPTYQKKSRWFSDKVPILVADGKLNLSKRQSIRRLKNAPVVIADSFNDDLEWTSINFAPKYEHDIRTENALISIWIIRNTSQTRFDKTCLNIYSTLGRYCFIRGAAIESDGSDRQLAVRPIGIGYSSGIDLRTLSIHIGSLEPGEEKVVFLPYVFTRGTEESEEIFKALEAAGADALLESTVNWWEKWTSQITEIRTPDEKFNDLLKGLAIAIKVNQASSGGLSQISEYSFSWLRDTHGPSLFYPLIGLDADYKTMLDYLWVGTLNKGNLSNAYELEYEMENLPQEPDWSNLGIMTGRTRAEGPSTLVLQYENYYRATGDITPVRERWAMLRHALLDQQFVDGCLMHFSSDETFEDLMEAVFGENMLNEPDESTLSFYSSLLMMRATNFMSEMAGRLGYPDDSILFSNLADSVRECAENTFWIKDRGYYAVKAATDTRTPHIQPYEDVNTMPLWFDVPLESARVQSNFNQMIKELGHTDGLLYSELPFIYRLFFPYIKKGVLTGMSHGYWLNNLDKMFHPMADTAFERWKDVFSASGNLDEAVVVDDFGHLSILREPFGFAGDVSARYRSWEAGIMGYAFLFHLTGYVPDVPDGRVKLSPHLPPGWNEMSFKGLAYGDSRFDLDVKRTAGNSRAITITTGPDAGFVLDMTLPVSENVTSVIVNGRAADFTTAVNLYERVIVKVKDIDIPAGTKMEIAVS